MAYTNFAYFFRPHRTTDWFKWYGRQYFHGKWKSQAARDYIIRKWVAEMKSNWNRLESLRKQSGAYPRKIPTGNIAMSINHFDPDKHTAYYNDDVAAGVGL